MFFKGNKNADSLQKPKELVVPLIPLRDIVVFPYMVVPLFVGREKSINALESSISRDKCIFLAAQKKAKTDEPMEEDIYNIGVLATILQLLRLPDGTVKVLVEGKKRAMVKEFTQSKDYFMVMAKEIQERVESELETEAVIRGCLKTFETYVKLNKNIPPEMIMSVSSIDDPSRLADTIVSHLTVKISDKQSILEIANITHRLEKLYAMMEGEIEILEVEQRIRTRVKKQMEKSQREYYLGEQMKAIQKEMGEKDEFKNEIAEIEEKIKNKKMSKEVQKRVRQEVKKLKLMPPMSAEATVVRNYIDCILSLPWMEVTEDKKDIDEAEKILEAEHYGLEKAKERIIEYLAVLSLVDEIKGPILCFVGPPGVGKTSLAKSIAKAMGRKFVRVSLGGVKDEAEIRGHRRTYIGSMPGKIIQSLKKAGSNNPVFLLDEVDKMSTDFRGDPASALLEVLDPEQNHTFDDHYLDLDYDLSNVMFITTANSLHGIPHPLLDRMEVIRIAGYTEEEKLNIAKRFLVPKQLKTHGLAEKNIKISGGAILNIIRYYTREAGVRNLEREIASICRKMAKTVLKKGRDVQIEVNQKGVAKFLGTRKYRYGIGEEKDEVGVATGLAWTEVGGELLLVEVTTMPGKGKLTITGKLGDVMQESAHAAMSYIRSRGEALGLQKDFYQKIDIHIHVPEGAIPKDGPSAGIAIAASIASALVKIPIKKDIAMTGEITLRGKVLPIGGLKEKILAAHRGNIKKVLMPKENEKDLKEIPQNIRRDIEIMPVEHMDEVLKAAFAADKPEEIFKRGADKAEAFGEKGGIAESVPDTQVITH